MIKSEANILLKFKQRWQRIRWFQVFLYALGPAILVYFTLIDFILALVTFVITFLLLSWFSKPWKLQLNEVSTFVDAHLKSIEYSSGLLLVPYDQLTALAKLQHHKISKELKKRISSVQPPHQLQKAVSILTAFILVGVIIYQFNVFGNATKPQKPEIQSEKIVFKPTDSAFTNEKRPTITHQAVTIRFPGYTNNKAVTTDKMNIRALQKSRLMWRLQFDREVDSVFLESNENKMVMNFDNGEYMLSSFVKASGFYNFRFVDANGNSFMSDLYAIEMLEDKNPEITITGIPQFSSFSFNEKKEIKIQSTITDDYGVKEAFIIATVSKGSGEAVKFREEKLSFREKMSEGAKKIQMSKYLDLDQMRMEPGDELYFYVEAIDIKKPIPNKTRSETFFAVINDTITNTFAVEGTLGADLMPAYFRSQRQLIIDTEKLIAEQPKLSEKEFKIKSNELGYEQKTLRIKYGEFMGDESEFEPEVERNIGPEGSLDDHGHDHEDPLESYTHKHDSENEHNLVDHQEEEAGQEDPLHEYLHNHDDPEESTLFTQSLKSKLRQALTEMWDAELQLRLYQPKKSLPYQYRALRLLQQIKNSARIYVHRIGFDPAPIKEDKRLSGDIKEIKNFSKNKQLEKPEKYSNIRQTISRLEELISSENPIQKNDQNLFENAGNELAAIAIHNPGKHLETLQKLKWLTENVEFTPLLLKEVQQGLSTVLPEKKPVLYQKKQMLDSIDNLLLKELESYD